MQCDDWVGSLEVYVWDVGAAVVCVRLYPCFSVVSPTVRDTLVCGIFWGSERFAWPFVVGEPGFSVAEGRVARVPTWLLVRTLRAVDPERVGYFLFALTPLAGGAVWLGAGGEVGASGRMIAFAMSRVRWRFVIPGIFCRGRGGCGTVASVAGASGRNSLVLRVSCFE